MLRKLHLWLWWRFTDLVAFFYRLFVGARFERIITCPNIPVPIRLWVVKGKLIPSWAGGVTIGRNIFTIERLKDYGPHLSHEIMHVRQSSRDGFWFLFHYLLEYLDRGYKNIDYEVEAREEGTEYWYDKDICE